MIVATHTHTHKSTLAHTRCYEDALITGIHVLTMDKTTSFCLCMSLSVFLSLGPTLLFCLYCHITVLIPKDRNCQKYTKKPNESLRDWHQWDRSTNGTPSMSKRQMSNNGEALGEDGGRGGGHKKMNVKRGKK